MAWHCTGKTNEELIQNLYKNDLIKSLEVRDAMMKVDRAHYTPNIREAYHDSPQPLGHSATISAPHMHAYASESLLPYLKPGSRVLDIGSGSGYLVHVFAELILGFGEGGERKKEKDGEGGNVGREKVGKGMVVGIEHIQALRDLGEGNMRKSADGRAFLDSGRVKFVRGDGRKGFIDESEIGDEDEKGWDAIHVGAAAVEVHEELVRQLRCPGRIFIPVQDAHGDQHIWTIDKDVNGVVEKKKLFGVRYVPLTDAPKGG